MFIRSLKNYSTEIFEERLLATDWSCVCESPNHRFFYEIAHFILKFIPFVWWCNRHLRIFFRPDPKQYIERSEKFQDGRQDGRRLFVKKSHIPLNLVFLFTNIKLLKLILTCWQQNHVHIINKTLNCVKAGQKYYILFIQNSKIA